MSNNNINPSKESTFAEAIANIYKPLNNNKKFKEEYKNDTFKILLNPKDGKFAALITVDNGKLSVESIENTSKKNLDQKVLGWNGLMQTTKELFSSIGRGELSTSDIAKKVVTRKIKVKNTKILTKFSELGSILRE
ncbi:MAG: hypothetical protein HWN81_01135 [Candidatus Lokiarchaeota archaeon]|nr:hypothetical protein [Candidatus Lokiarchaeota archaeon]